MPDGSNFVNLAPGVSLDPTELVARCEASFSSRTNFHTTWERSRQRFLPDVAPFNFTNQTPGQRDRETTVDTYGQFCARTHATFLYGAIINGDGDWFKVTASEGRGQPEPGQDILAYCDETREELAEIMMAESTGFTEQVYAMLLERTVFGNGVLYGGDRPGALPIVRCGPMRDNAWEGGAGHEPVTHWWKQTLTAAEWARKFPGRDIGPLVREKAASITGRNETFTFIHGCMENPGWTPSVVDQAPPQRRFLTVWLNEREKHLVNAAWLTSNPYTAFRCPRRANELYGRGPADEALEEAELAQRVRIAVLRGMEKTIDPTMLLPSDGILTPPTNEPEGAIVVDSALMRGSHDPVRYLKSEARPDIGQEFLREGIYGAMDRAFARDVMNLPREPRMIESQIIGLQEEQSRGVVPLVAPLFAPMGRFIGRIYDIAHRQRRLPRPPLSMAGYTLSIEFRNPLEKAARLAEVRAFMQALSILVQAVQIDPGARHALKIVEGVQYCARILGVPEKLIPTKKEIDTALQAAAQIQNQAMQTENALDQSTILKNLGHAMRNGAPQGAKAP